MSMQKFVPGAVIADAGLGPRQIKVVASDATPDRVGDIMVPEGCDLSNYRRNPIVLADHDPSKPVGTAQVSITGGKVIAVITFAPVGTSHKADEYCGLAKAGIINAVSVGFKANEARPIPGGGTCFVKWELMELSLVAVPCNPAALVIARSHQKVGREISAANAAKLREAHRHAEAARAIVADVLGGADTPDGELGAEWQRRQRLIAIAKSSEPEVTQRELARAARLRRVLVLEVAGRAS